MIKSFIIGILSILLFGEGCFSMPNDINYTVAQDNEVWSQYYPEQLIPNEELFYSDATEEEKQALAKLLYGEAQTCCTIEQAAVIWCVLNRLDSDDPYFPDTLMGVITQPNQFFGYRKDYPVLPELMEIVEDVLNRYAAEQAGIDNVSRVLPREYLYFSGDGEHNYFTVTYADTDVWDWRLYNPYTE